MGQVSSIKHVAIRDLAEAFADVYCNGSNASAESKAVVAELDAYFRR